VHGFPSSQEAGHFGFCWETIVIVIINPEVIIITKSNSITNINSLSLHLEDPPGGETGGPAGCESAILLVVMRASIKI
jgi:hypothetical protein